MVVPVSQQLNSNMPIIRQPTPLLYQFASFLTLLEIGTVARSKPRRVFLLEIRCYECFLQLLLTPAVILRFK